MSAMLEVKDLSVAYGKVEALRGAKLLVGAGRIVTVIGPNGAGKTTLLNAIMGLLPSRGTVEFDGAALRQLHTEARVAKGLVLVPERRELFAEMS
ncbi:MAG: ATP-binding cassette domain-containing protein, partial [Alphaproteobacteria bacterium]